MLIILGIAILAISFVIALFSLVVEERKREKLIAEQEEEPDDAKKVVESTLAPTTPNVSAAASLKGEALKEEMPGILQEEPQVWYQDLAKTETRSEEKVPESAGPDEDMHPRDARFSSLGESSLSGEIKIGDISKKQQ